MVLSTRRPRDRVKTSGIAKKKAKNNYKGHKKDNYKKVKCNVAQYVDCSICFNKVSNTSDNSVKCGKTIHFICGECKFRCNETGNDKCPMCRSHPLRNPIARDIMLPVIQGERLKKPITPYVDLRMSPKERRMFLRSVIGEGRPPFNPNSNRMVRERSGTGTGRSPRPGSVYHIFDRTNDLGRPPFGWRKWFLRGGDIMSRDGKDDRQGRRWPRIALNYEAGVAHNTLFNSDNDYLGWTYLDESA